MSRTYVHYSKNVLAERDKDETLFGELSSGAWLNYVQPYVSKHPGHKYGTTRANRMERRAIRSVIRSGNELEGLPTKHTKRIAGRNRCPYCGTLFWHCAC